METLLDWLNARTLTAAAMLAAAACLGVTFQDQTRNWYHRWKYTSQTEKTGLASEIERDLDAKASLKLRALHREVRMDISRAIEEGFAVGPLLQTADGILQLDRPALRSQAIDSLQKLRLSIPKRTPKLRLINEEDETDETATPGVKSAGRARVRKR
ncbi:MAG: hypothetical protein AAB262_14390 [Elusimicrobiota bacterium]